MKNITRWNYIHLPKIKRIAHTLKEALIIAIILLTFMAIGGMTYPY